MDGKMKTTENKLAFYGWVGLLLMLCLAYFCSRSLQGHNVTDRERVDVVECFDVNLDDYFNSTVYDISHYTFYFRPTGKPHGKLGLPPGDHRIRFTKVYTTQADGRKD
jgi:hypothetical protein